MSIEKLENAFKEFTLDIFDTKKIKENGLDDVTIIISFLICQTATLINILKHQSDQIADLRQKLAKKEDAIDIGDVIKEARLRNG